MTFQSSNRVWPLLLSAFIIACGGDTGEPDDPNETPTGEATVQFFTSTGGADKDSIPLVGARFEKDAVFVGSFAVYCDVPEGGAVNYADSERVSETLDESAVYRGPDVFAVVGADENCSYDVGYQFEVGDTLDDLPTATKLLASGNRDGFENGLFDIEFTEISEIEFYRILKAETAGKGFDYKTIDDSESSPSSYDGICNALSGVDCIDKF